mmetsp:Transcript_14738/g.48095  ORF Transcript_14738/g.48095 Transcript_14738/m.48095 type:complete len:400 (+) Transcript_14738:139-1338(+)
MPGPLQRQRGELLLFWRRNRRRGRVAEEARQRHLAGRRQGREGSRLGGRTPERRPGLARVHGEGPLGSGGNRRARATKSGKTPAEEQQQLEQVPKGDGGAAVPARGAALGNAAAPRRAAAVAGLGDVAAVRPVAREALVAPEGERHPRTRAGRPADLRGRLRAVDVEFGEEAGPGPRRLRRRLRVYEEGRPRQARVQAARLVEAFGGGAGAIARGGQRHAGPGPPPHLPAFRGVLLGATAVLFGDGVVPRRRIVYGPRQAMRRRGPARPRLHGAAHGGTHAPNARRPPVHARPGRRSQRREDGKLALRRQRPRFVGSFEARRLRTGQGLWWGDDLTKRSPFAALLLKRQAELPAPKVLRRGGRRPSRRRGRRSENHRVLPRARRVGLLRRAGSFERRVR